jgi:GntR family transcriptional regulator
VSPTDIEEFPLDQSNKATPLYKILKNDLHGQIESGVLKPGELIPSERALCKQYGISRITVRRCFSEMIHEGILYRKHGKGTFVAMRKIKQGLTRIVDFNRTVRELGMKPSTSILSNELISADIEIAKVFALSIAAPILKLSLLGKGDGEPLVLYESYFLPETGRKIAREALIREKKGAPFSTYDLYDESAGVFPFTVNQAFEAITANDRLSLIMKLKKGAPVLRITSIFLDRNQQPLEFRKAMYRGDRYKFHIVRDFSAQTV